MTINKNLVQTLAVFGLYPKTPGFTHDQLYVAVFRVTSERAIRILTENEDATCGSETRNIVFSEIFQSLAS